MEIARENLEKTYFGYASDYASFESNPNPVTHWGLKVNYTQTLCGLRKVHTLGFLQPLTYPGGSLTPTCKKCLRIFKKSEKMK